MTAAVAATPQKRILTDSTNSRRNIAFSPQSAKKRKLDSSPATAFKGLPRGSNSNNNKFGSSQPRSQFEEEVLDKLTQDLNGLKQNNSERDQQWARPSLGDFNPALDNLCFQSIEAEEGTLHGGKATVRLFGVTEVRIELFIHPS